MPKKPNPFAGLAAEVAKPTKATATPAKSAPAASVPAAPKSAALAALTRSNATAAPLRRTNDRDYPKIYLRKQAGDDERIRKILGFLIDNRRSPNLSAAVRVSMKLAPSDTSFLEKFDKFKDTPAGDERVTINLLPDQQDDLAKLRSHLVAHDRHPSAGGIARTSMMMVPLDTRFLQEFDKMIDSDKRGRRPAR